MPQATEELRNEWRHHEEGGGDQAAIWHLTHNGFRLNDDWTWTPLSGRPVTDKDRSAIRYLIDEWDYSGLDNSTAALHSRLPAREQPC